MIIFSILNDCINAAEVFMSKRHYSAPISYKEMIELLEAKKAITAPTAKKMKLLFSKRNLIAHECGTINEKDILGLMGHRLAGQKIPCRTWQQALNKSFMPTKTKREALIRFNFFSKKCKRA